MKRHLLLPIGLTALLIACSEGRESGNSPATVRLGYFANVTHAPAIVALEQGFFAEALGAGVSIEPRTFNAGPEAVEALFSDALDLTYIGPNPAINAFAQSGGEAIRIVAGATSGGAALVVRPGITQPADLVGKKLATPQLGNTQDVAPRLWLKERGLSANLEGGGDVSVRPQANAQTLETFRAGEIQGAWVPEPWATRLVLEDEHSLWPDGRFVTTHLVVRAKFLAEHPDRVAAVLRGHVRAVDLVNAEPARAKEIVNAAITKLVGKGLPAAVIERSWGNLEFTVDPIASSLRRSAEDVTAVGLLDPVSLDGIYDLRLLNEILAAAGKPPITL
jgi:NitT/TauT family transport system substrate-binding protein